jgi:hypothetical protein
MTVGHDIDAWFNALWLINIWKISVKCNCFKKFSFFWRDKILIKSSADISNVETQLTLIRSDWLFCFNQCWCIITCFNLMFNFSIFFFFQNSKDLTIVALNMKFFHWIISNELEKSEVFDNFTLREPSQFEHEEGEMSTQMNESLNDEIAHVLACADPASRRRGRHRESGRARGG